MEESARKQPDSSISKRWNLLLVTLVAATSIGNGWLLYSMQQTGRWAKYLLLTEQTSADRLADVSVLYLLILKALRAVSLSPTIIIPIQFVLLALTAILLGRVALRLFGPAAALVTAALVMQNRAALVNASEAEVETFILFCNAAGLALLLHPPRRFRAGLVFGFSIALRPVALLPVLAISLPSRGRRLRFLGAAIALPALVLLISFLLTGKLGYMSPGKVFYEGMNPKASGLAWEDPRIVRDLSAGRQEPDYEHVAFRIVAKRAGSRSPTLFWTGKALAYLQAFPGRAFRLTLVKIRLALSGADIFDVAAMRNKAEKLPRFLYIPYSLLVALALLGVLQRNPSIHLLLLYLAGYLAVLATFFVTARLRNPLLPAMALLGGAGAGRICGLLRDRRFFLVLFLFAIGFLAASSLQYETNLLREARYREEAADAWNSLLTESGNAAKSGDVNRMMQERAKAATLAAGVPLLVPTSFLTEAIVSKRKNQPSPALTFDLAIAATDAGDPATAGLLLATLKTYRPRRGSDCHGCLAYQRARHFLRSGRKEQAEQQLAAARIECPADDAFLALEGRVAAGATAREEANELLDRLYDPFTAALARAMAAADTNHPDEAASLAAKLAVRFPEWRTPRTLERRWTDEALMGIAPFSDGEVERSSP